MDETKFDKKLNDLINKTLDGLPDSESGESGEEEEVVFKELLPIRYEEVQTATSVENNKDLNDDYKFVRSNLYGLIGRSNAAIDLVLKIAAMSEHPRALEVASSLMKTSSDISKQLLELQKAVKEEKTKESPGVAKMYQQNNYYGSQDPKQNDTDFIEGQLDELDEIDDETPRE